MKPIPPVNPDHIVEAHRKVLADREAYGSPDVTVSCVSAFHGRLRSKEILNITHRLYALATFLEQGQAKGWIEEKTGAEYILVNDAALRAAARAPLMEAEYIKDMNFDKDTFLPIVLEEAQTAGKA